MIILEGIDHGHGFDWNRTSGDYARYRDIYPNSFYENIEKIGLCGPGQRVLDLGTGTVVLPRGLHACGAKFVGADVAPGQIEAARRLSHEAGMDDIEYVVGPAEGLALPGAAFDTALACMCFHYMDPEQVLPNIHRMLRPGGRFAILSMNWLPQEDEIAGGTERLILQHNPHWTGGGFARRAPETPEWAGPSSPPAAPWPMWRRSPSQGRHGRGGYAPPAVWRPPWMRRPCGPLRRTTRPSCWGLKSR